MSGVRIVDYNEKEITVGMTVLYGCPDDDKRADAMVVVTEVTDPDGDYDDELGRAVEIPPSVKVRFVTSPDETHSLSTRNITSLSWADYPDGPDVMTYEVDDLEVVA